MGTFVLVHGSFHGGWCWDHVAARLTAMGHRALAPDLPGRGGDAAQTLDSYARAIGNVITSEHEPVVLVGHSMGGVVVTTVAERMPERVQSLVYVCAFMPLDGQSLVDIARVDNESTLMHNLVFDEQAGLHWVKPEGALASFYHDCPPTDAERAMARLGKEPLAVVATPVTTTQARFGRVRRTYVECTDDRALSPSAQQRMHEAQPCRVVPLASSHSPFYARPDALTRILVESA